jgi:glycosyltransferase involved in cell wall biosynthesis
MPWTVAYLCEFPTLLGGERSLLTFLASCGPSLVRPVVVAPAEGALARRLAECALRRVDWPRAGRHAADALAERLGPDRVDLVHANSLMTADAGLAVARRLGVPEIAHVRDMMKLSAARRRRLSELNALVAVSGAVADWLVEQALPRERIETIYNAVDADALQRCARRGTWRRRLGLAGEPLIGCIGQIALRKGQDVFLAAAALLAPRVPDAQFVLAGARYSAKSESRAFEQRLHDLGDAAPLRGRVHFPGYVDDVPSLLADLDVLVVPSRQEPLSRTLLEALALGTPAVATAVGGTPEILGQSAAGIGVPADDPAEMANAVHRLLADHTLRAALCSAGRARVRERFAPQAQVEAVVDLYRRISSGT